MSSRQDSPAVALVRAHVEAWNNHDFAKARTGLAPDVHVTAVTTLPGVPLTDLTGTEDYMQGLIYFAQTLKPGSVRELASVVMSATRCSCWPATPPENRSVT